MNFLFGSISLGKWLGTEVKLHNTLLIYFGLLFLTGSKVIFILPIVFLSVLIHEYGHVLMARHFGYHADHIILTPIGGLASFTHLPRTSKQELLITIAGPAVNFVLFFIFFPLSGIAGILSLGILNTFFALIAVINAILFIFNLLPILPMDGGRILRSLLHYKYSFYDSTKFTVIVSKIIIIPLGLFFLIQGSFLSIFMLGFIWLAGNMELEKANEYQSISNNYRLKNKYPRWK